MKNVKYCVLDYCKTKNQFMEKYNKEQEGKLSPFEIGIPLLDISDKTIEEIYYFRWHTFCRHIKYTPDGYVITEFLPKVPWSGIYNTINCPAGHHLYEGRWLHDQKYIDSYSRFWFTENADRRKYSFWAANSIESVCEIWGDYTLAEELYEQLKENYAAWEREKQMESGLFYQIDSRDGMEYSVGGSGCRPSNNSYMYGDAVALAKIAIRLGKTEDAQFYANKAKDIRDKVNAWLWDEDAVFYKTLAEKKDYQKADVRELIGYIPWCFNLPEAEDHRKVDAWKFLNDEKYFAAPYGPTTAERCHPDFMKEFDHECLWNGPSWPFATSQTLTALGNLLCNYEQTVMRKSDYYQLLNQYARCQYLTEDGKTVPFIDEDLDPFTGEWLARKILRTMENPPGGIERGKDYNHSTFCDLVLSGLVGVRAMNENILRINPLFEEADLEYLCADGILYRGHSICVLWDRNGNRYHKGIGLHVYCDGVEVFADTHLNEVVIRLNN